MLLKDLQDPELTVRHQAVTALSTLGHSGRDGLKIALANEDPETRRLAVDALVTAIAIPELATALRSEDERLRSAAATAIFTTDANLTQIISIADNAADEKLSNAIDDQIAAMGAKVVPFLTANLTKPNMRFPRLLGRIKGLPPATISALVEAFTQTEVTKSERVAYEVATYSSYGAKTSSRIEYRDQAYVVTLTDYRDSLDRALLQVGSDAVPALLRGMAREPRLNTFIKLSQKTIDSPEGSGSAIYRGAERVMKKIGNDALIPIAISMRSEEILLACAALVSVDACSATPPDLVEAVVAASKNSDAQVRYLASRQMARIVGADARLGNECLSALIHDANPEIRGQAIAQATSARSAGSGCMSSLIDRLDHPQCVADLPTVAVLGLFILSGHAELPNSNQATFSSGNSEAALILNAIEAICRDNDSAAHDAAGRIALMKTPIARTHMAICLGRLPNGVRQLELLLNENVSEAQEAAIAGLFYAGAKGLSGLAKAVETIPTANAPVDSGVDRRLDYTYQLQQFLKGQLSLGEPFGSDATENQKLITQLMTSGSQNIAENAVTAYKNRELLVSQINNGDSEQRRLAARALSYAEPLGLDLITMIWELARKDTADEAAFVGVAFAAALRAEDLACLQTLLPSASVEQQIALASGLASCHRNFTQPNDAVWLLVRTLMESSDSRVREMVVSAIGSVYLCRPNDAAFESLRAAIFGDDESVRRAGMSSLQALMRHAISGGGSADALWNGTAICTLFFETLDARHKDVCDHARQTLHVIPKSAIQVLVRMLMQDIEQQFPRGQIGLDVTAVFATMKDPSTKAKSKAGTSSAAARQKGKSQPTAVDQSTALISRHSTVLSLAIRELGDSGENELVAMSKHAWLKNQGVEFYFQVAVLNILARSPTIGDAGEELLRDMIRSEDSTGVGAQAGKLLARKTSSKIPKK